MLKNKRLAFFLTDGVSLRIWDEIGILQREIAVYNSLAEDFEKIYIVSYGDKSELEYKTILKSNIEILYKTSKLQNFAYQFLIPFKFKKTLKGCNYFKTNQIYGSLPAIISKIIMPWKKLIVRSGYVASLNAKLYKSSFLEKLKIYLNEFLAYRLCDKAIITTEENREYLAKKYRFLEKKLEVIENTIDTDIFKKIQTQKIFDIGYVGRLQKDKNIMALLQAVKGTKLEICIIGQGEEEKSILQYAKMHKISLTHIKKVKNHLLAKYFNQFKIFIFPSLHEGSPKALLEAMSCALPVIGCNVVGVKNIIKDGENGLLSGTDYKSLQKVLKRILEDRHLQDTLGENGRLYIEKYYAFNKIIKKEKAIYEKNN